MTVIETFKNTFYFFAGKVDSFNFNTKLPPMPENENDQPKKGIGINIPTLIALVIVLFSFTLLIIMIAEAFRKADTQDQFNNVKDIIGLFLPIVGTWMGTILAFYFSRENFESANRSMQQTISKLTTEEKLKSTKATAVMIPLSGIDHPFKDGKTPADTTIKELLDFLDKTKRNRIVVIDDKNIVSKVLHRSVINSFVSDEVINKAKLADAVQQLKIEDMEKSDKSDITNVLKNGIEFISQDATLFDAQQKMIANKNCQDVFITPTGSRTEGVIGWISNFIVTDNAKV